MKLKCHNSLIAIDNIFLIGLAHTLIDRDSNRMTPSKENSQGLWISGNSSMLDQLEVFKRKSILKFLDN